MRKCIILVLSLLFTAHLYAPNSRKGIEIWEPTPIKIDVFKLLNWSAIVQVERPNTIEEAIAAKKRENAVGIAQIRPDVVLDVNQILGYHKYWLSDREDSTKSAEMFLIYQMHYNPTLNPRIAAYLWNGGSNYMNASPKVQKKLERYWSKVQEKIKNN